MDDTGGQNSEEGIKAQFTDNKRYVVKINVDKTLDGRIEGSVPWRELFRCNPSPGISDHILLCNSEDCISTVTQDIPNGLSLKRYLPNSQQFADNNRENTNNLQNLKSFLIDAKGNYTELTAMSKSKQAPEVVGLGYKKNNNIAYVNPAFVSTTPALPNAINQKDTDDDLKKGEAFSIDISNNPFLVDGVGNNADNLSQKSPDNENDETPTSEKVHSVHFVENTNSESDFDSVKISIPENNKSLSLRVNGTTNLQHTTNGVHNNNNNVSSPGTPAVEDEEIKWLSWMEIQFKKIAGDDSEISLEEFKNALGVKKSFFAERFFKLFDSDGSGTIECEELMTGLRKLTKGTPTEKLKFLFDVYDMDGSGTIDIEELKTVLRSCMEESSLKLSEDDLDSLTALLFESADDDGSGEITFEELKAELEKHPGVIDNLTISAAQWLKPPGKKKSKDGFTRYFTKRYIMNNLRKVIFFIWYVLANIGFGVYAAWNYRKSNGFIIVARIGGMNLNFNCMFILVLMLRKSLTYLRMTKVAMILPIDQHILFHKMVGAMIAVYSIIHTLAHLGNAILMDRDREDLQLWEILFTTKAGYGWVYDTAVVTGWALDIIVIIIIICSMPFVRRGGYFQVFYWTHMLYVPFWILVIIHGSNFWKWFVAPGLIFIAEKISRSKFIKLARYGSTYVEEITLLPSGVTHLEITRPNNFRYQAGDYVFIQIPVIASHEWHPFTISSAPEMDGRIWLHVRSAGHWTKKLYEYFESYDPGESDDIDEDEELAMLDEIERRRRSTVHARRKSTIDIIDKQRSLSFSRALSVISNIVRRKSQARKYSLNEYVDPVSCSSVRRKSKFQKYSVKEYVDPVEAAKQRRINSKNKKVKIKCFIDGPYGTATREIFDTEHAVLVGAGIGVTPMASILQSIMYRYKESIRKCPKCSYSWFGSLSHTSMKTRKVDFIWINRDQKAFEWFVSLLTNLELEQSLDNENEEESKIIDMHMFMTAAQKKTDMKGIGLQIALDLMHEKSNKDLITGLKTKTQPGRPDWNKLFNRFANENKGKIKVFFCGAPQLGKIVKEACEKFKFSFSKENF